MVVPLPQRDCISCKIVGTATFAGVASYMIYLRHFTPKNDRIQRAFLAAFGASSLAMAIFRAST